MTPLGPDGMNARIAQIQSRLDALSPSPAPAIAAPAGMPPALTFGQTFEAVCPMNPSLGQVSPLSGPIGAKSDLKTMAETTAQRYGLDPVLFSALVEQESGWDPQATSRVGAKGLCQLMDGTARDLGVSNPYDPQQSLDGGARYLRQMLDRFGGDRAKALAAYNAGPGFVSRHTAAEWPGETKGYVRNILANSGPPT
jgi:soluble lytic murein transglycosylase-like protein